MKFPQSENIFFHNNKQIEKEFQKPMNSNVFPKLKTMQSVNS